MFTHIHVSPITGSSMKAMYTTKEATSQLSTLCSKHISQCTTQTLSHLFPCSQFVLEVEQPTQFKQNQQSPYSNNSWPTVCLLCFSCLIMAGFTNRCIHLKMQSSATSNCTLCSSSSLTYNSCGTNLLLMSSTRYATILQGVRKVYIMY